MSKTNTATIYENYDLDWNELDIINEKIKANSNSEVKTTNVLNGSDPYHPYYVEEITKPNLIFKRPQVIQQNQDQFRSLQKWVGIVTDIRGELFFARINDLTNEKNPPEIAEIPIEEISPEQRNHIEKGAIFYWNIGYLDASGTRYRQSFIRFRNLPLWNDEDLEIANQKAKKLKEYFDSKSASSK